MLSLARAAPPNATRTGVQRGHTMEIYKRKRVVVFLYDFLYSSTLLEVLQVKRQCSVC